MLRPPIPRFADIASSRNLFKVAENLKVAGEDKAPGPDEARFADLSLSELWVICRSLSRVLLDSSYDPSARWIVELMKRDGGKRPISIRSIVHRIVTTAIYWALYPSIEPTFVQHSFRFMHERSAWCMLLAMVVATRYWLARNLHGRAVRWLNPIPQTCGTAHHICSGDAYTT